YDTILPLYEHALTVLESTLGAQHPNVAVQANTLATFYEECGQLDRALAFREKALSIQENALAPRDPAMIVTLQQLASLYEKVGKRTEAEQMLARMRAAAPGQR
ncbi:MAG: tetratricopeptide repeat protein, partial [Candidatus Binatia bacterium]|nr:tetratricopeptide repeat protein [Candidatus Binatia bacterium]